MNMVPNPPPLSLRPAATLPARLRARARRCLYFAILATAAPTCFAQHGLSVAAGSRANVDSIGLQWTLPPWYRSEPGGWRVSGSPEIQLQRHHRDGDTLYQGGVFANFRFERPLRTLRPYLEFGLGLNVFSRKTLGPTSYSTRFQFGQQLGAGVSWGGTPGGEGETWLGVRIMHYSNAGIRKPNPGLETTQIILGHRF